MAKLVRLNRKYWPRGGAGHWCPGCNNGHEIDTEVRNAQGAKWGFNCDAQRPTFTPSINIRWGRFADPEWKPSDGEEDHSGVCHYFITDGKIIFLSDCTHALAGQTVDLPDVPAHAYISCARM